MLQGQKNEMGCRGASPLAPKTTWWRSSKLHSNRLDSHDAWERHGSHYFIPSSKPRRHELLVLLVSPNSLLYQWLISVYIKLLITFNMSIISKDLQLKVISFPNRDNILPHSSNIPYLLNISNLIGPFPAAHHESLSTAPET